MVYIYLNKKAKIIEDIGYIKTQTILLGLLLYYISCNFNVFYNYCNCALNILFKHSGVLLVYMISIIYTLTGCELGVKREELHLYLNSSTSSGSTNNQNSDVEQLSHKNPVITTLINEKEIMNIENQLNQNPEDNLMVHSLTKGKYKYSKVTLFKKKNDDKKDIKNLNKLVSNIHSFYTEIISLYILFLIVFISSIGYYEIKTRNHNSNYIQEYDGKWRYECPLSNLDFIFNLSEFALLIYLMAKIIKVYNFVYIFSCLKNILYISIIWITFGPLINVKKYKNKIYHSFLF